MPFQDFQGSDDAIVSRLELDVDDNQVTAMKSITAVTDSLKTNLQAIVRFSESFDTYLKTIPEISRVAERAQETTIKQMERQGQLQDKLIDGQKALIANFKEIAQVQKDLGQSYGPSSTPAAVFQSPVATTPPVASDYRPRHAQQQAQEHPQKPQEGFQAPAAPATPDVPSTPAQGDQKKQDLHEYIQQVASESVKRQQEVRKRYEGLDERELIDTLRARGLGQESMEGGNARLHFKLPNGTISASDLGNEQTRGRVLDYLSQEERGESGGIASRVGKASRGLGNLADFTRKDTMGQIKQASDFVGGLGKSGGVLDAASASGGVMGGVADGAMAGIGMASKAVPYVGAAVAAYEGVEKGAQVYQGFKNEGSVVGGGAAEGFQIEAGVRTMAMNPFISTEQARQIMMAGLQDGAKGKQLDMMTDYLAKNMTDMNISVADSMKMVQTNVHQGGESLDQLSNQLKNLQTMAKDSNTSFGDMQQQFQEVSKQGVSQGMSGLDAGQMGQMAAGMFQDNEKLKNKGGDLIKNLTANQAFMAQVGHQEGFNGDPSEVALRLKGDQITDGMEKVLKQRASDYKGSPGRFRNWLASQGWNVDINTANELQNQLLKDDSIFKKGQEKAQQASEAKSDEGNWFTNTMGGAWNATKAVGGAAKGGVGVVVGAGQASVHSATGWGSTDWGAVKKTADKDFGGARNDMAYADKGDHGYMNTLVDSYGAKNVFIDTGKGDATSFESFDWTDEATKKLNSGEWKVKTKKDGKTQEGTLQDYAAGGGQIATQQRAEIASAAGKPQSVTVNVDASEKAKELFNFSSPNSNLSNNQVAANTAHGGATANNPAPDNGR